MEPYERPLQYMAAAEALPVLADLLAEEEEDRGAASSITNNQPGQRPGAAQNRGTGSQAGSSVGGIDVTGSRLEGPMRDTAPQSIIVGKTTLIADNQANSILVIGPPENRDKVRTILDRLDKRPMQVYLATVIGQLTLGDGINFGVDLIQKYVSDGTHGIASIQRTRGAEQPVITIPDLVDSTEFPLAGGLTVFGQVDEALDIFVHTLEETNRFRVLSRPSIYTANNKQATIISGQQVAVPTSTLSSLDNASNDNVAVTSNIQYRDVVLKLDVIPLINANREITLQIDQANNTILGTQVISGNEVPIIGTQSLNTTVTIPNRSTIVLGGLITESNNHATSGTPFLGRVPLLGYFFRQTRKDKDRTELIVLIQPTVVEATSEALDVSFDEQSRTRVGREIRTTDFQRPPGFAPGPVYETNVIGVEETVVPTGTVMPAGK
jgi:general secretion pathway protein D